MAGLFHEFLAHLKNTGVSKTSHFQVTIPTPSIPGADAGRILAFRCEATELPGRQLVTQDNRVYGPIYKTPYQSLYQDITMTFLETADLYARRFFELWMDAIFSAASNQMIYPDSYRREIQITQYDMTVSNTATAGTTTSTISGLAPVATWHLISSFPISINQMPVSWTEDGFHRVSVTFAYEYYLMSTPATPKKQLKPEAKGAVRQPKGSAIR